jgi:hypothetical protein
VEASTPELAFRARSMRLALRQPRKVMIRAPIPMNTPQTPAYMLSASRMLNGSRIASSTVATPSPIMSRPARALASYQTRMSANVAETLSPYRRLGGTRLVASGQPSTMKRNPESRNTSWR